MLCCLPLSLISAGKKSRSFGIYAGWSFSGHEGFEWSSHRYITYREGISFQLGFYNEFILTKNLALQGELNYQHHFQQYDGSWSYDYKEDYQKGTDGNPVLNLVLNAVLSTGNHNPHYMYVLVGGGVGFGTTDLNIYEETHPYFQAGVGGKYSISRNLKLNILIRASLVPAPEESYGGKAVTYVAFIAGIEL